MKIVKWEAQDVSFPELSGVDFSKAGALPLKKFLFALHISEKQLVAKYPVIVVDDMEAAPAEPAPEVVVDEEPKSEDVDDNVPFTDDSNPKGGEF